MKDLNRTTAGIDKKLPLKVLQFGEGNFLRGFVNYIIDKLNTEANFNAGVVVVQPIAHGMVNMINDQDGLYTLFLKGLRNGQEIEEKRLITCIEKGVNPYLDYEEYLKLGEGEDLELVFSNTTEAGISFDPEDKFKTAPPNSFPAKLTALLYRRFKHFNGDRDKGLTIIPCELINNNADSLKEIILKYAKIWELENEFMNWINESNFFHNTLVDRIVPGYPKDEIEEYQSQLEYKDNLIVSAEIFLLWVIEGGDELKKKIPFDNIDENILVIKDMQPYRTRKVRILNGAHTVMVPFSLMYGNETVKESMDNEFTGKFVKNAVLQEINATLDLPDEELNSFANDVFDRFRNPFIKHQLSSIALNSVSKFKVRVLPSLLAYEEKFSELPVHLTFAFACLIRFYKGEWKGSMLPVQDEAKLISEFQEIWELNSYREIATQVLGNKEYWDQDLNTVPGLTESIAKALNLIETSGIEDGFNEFESTTVSVGKNKN
ncbi:MAG TPA: tagaturonate reductase [Gillisia sp.]|nr:tagaturonate reductase [Gillisia sp.]